MIDIFERVIRLNREAIKRLDGNHGVIVFVGRKEWIEIIEYKVERYRWFVNDKMYFASLPIERVNLESFLGYGIEYEH